MICKYIYNKKKIALIGFIILLGLTGMYALYSMLFFQANRTKWRPLERMGEGWYYYISNIPSQEEDSELVYIEKNFTALGTKQLNSFDGYDLYICSQETWEMYDYLLKSGENFSKTNENQVIVSSDMETQHPVGSTMQIRIWDTASFYGKPDPVETIECTVAGVMKQDKVLFSQSPDSPAFSHRISESMFSEGFYGFNAEQVCQVFLNPRFEVKDSSWYQCSSGIFFKAHEADIMKMNEEYPNHGTIHKVTDILAQNSPVYGNGKYLSLIRILLFSLACVVYLVVWLTSLLMSNKRDFAFLIYINGHLTGRAQTKRFHSYCNRIYAMVFLTIPPAFLLSSLAWLIPNELDGFWEINGFMFLIVLGIQCLVCGLGVLGLKLINHKYMGKVQKFLDDCPVQKLYIDDLSVKDNLVLALTAQGYQTAWAEEYVAQELEEQEISYCRSRKMGMISDEERIVINKIREKFLDKK